MRAPLLLILLVCFGGTRGWAQVPFLLDPTHIEMMDPAGDNVLVDGVKVSRMEIGGYLEKKMMAEGFRPVIFNYESSAQITAAISMARGLREAGCPVYLNYWGFRKGREPRQVAIDEIIRTEVVRRPVQGSQLDPNPTKMRDLQVKRLEAIRRGDLLQ